VNSKKNFVIGLDVAPSSSLIGIVFMVPASRSSLYSVFRILIL
jgi:hypothetical protein